MRKRYVEILGLPSAGKTTLAERLAAQGLGRRELIREAAESCPVTDKTSKEFNLWTAGWTLAQIAEALPRTSSLIVDRGMLDALAWLEFHANRSNAGHAAAQMINSVGALLQPSHEVFFIYLTVPFEVAVNRRGGDVGRIVNEDSWPAIQRAYLAVVEHMQNVVPILTLDTRDKNPGEVSQLVEEWLEH